MIAKLKQLATRAQARLAKIEPAWMATRRKAIISPIASAATGVVTAWIARVGIHLSPDQTAWVAGAVMTGTHGLVTWLVPNKSVLPSP